MLLPQNIDFVVFIIQAKNYVTFDTLSEIQYSPKKG